MAELKYFKRFKGEEAEQEITYDKALETLLSTWADTDMTRDMLTIPNYIECRFSYVRVSDENSPYVPIPGLWNLTPDGVEYDEETFMRK